MVVNILNAVIVFYHNKFKTIKYIELELDEALVQYYDNSIVNVYYYNNHKHKLATCGMDKYQMVVRKTHKSRKIWRPFLGYFLNL